MDHSPLLLRHEEEEDTIFYGPSLYVLSARIPAQQDEEVEAPNLVAPRPQSPTRSQDDPR